MSVAPRHLSALYKRSHDHMRDIDGLQPQEAFDELLKYLFLRESADAAGHRFPAMSVSPLNGVSYSNERLTEDLRLWFRKFIARANSWTSELWSDGAIHLSDAALLGVHELFAGVDFSAVKLDIRSAALNAFIPGGLRKGLGIFTTPDPVARMMTEIISPSPDASVFDPACGTGTFLVEAARYRNVSSSKPARQRVWGVDKSARMLTLSELTLGHDNLIEYRRALADSLYQPPSTLFPEASEGFDCILTNPPFGVSLELGRHDLAPFQTCRGLDGKSVKRQQSEVVFMERCMQYLKPGGVLGIVLPRSVVSNSSLHAARRALNELGYIEGIVNLPPETFASAGTHTNTVALFLRRYKSDLERAEPVSVAFADVSNVGFDATGRPRRGSQLTDTARAMKAAIDEGRSAPGINFLPEVSKGDSIVRIPDLLSERLAPVGASVIKLKDVLEIATNGRTPGRSSYSSEGLFVVKVGNLTGRGINWEPRERNFISGAQEAKRNLSAALMLKRGDILLTSSAHSPVYIAKKADVVGAIPKWVGGKASFVGEIMMLRTKSEIDPMVLLAYLRLPGTQKLIRSLIRGQTAHLHPKDILDLRIPEALVNPTSELRSLADKIGRETALSRELNEVAYRQRVESEAVERSLLERSR